MTGEDGPAHNFRAQVVRELPTPVQETPQLRTLSIQLNLQMLNDLHRPCSFSVTQLPVIGKNLSSNEPC
jgi:hypothetical protein